MNASANVGDQTIPILPSRSIAQTLTFYRVLGFTGDAHPHDAGYAILQRGDVELHFFAHPDLDPAACYAGCYLRVTDVDAVYAAMRGSSASGTRHPTDRSSRRQALGHARICDCG